MGILTNFTSKSGKELIKICLFQIDYIALIVNIMLQISSCLFDINYLKRTYLESI